MNGATKQVNILLHGLFFMRLNTQNNNLEVLVPDIPDHHFVGGERGSRHEITAPLVNHTNLTGTQADPSLRDLPGSVLQFLRSQTDITLFTGDFSKFKSIIVLRWPQAFYSLRCGDIDKSFPFVPDCKVGKSIAANASVKGSKQLGTVTLLRYTTSGTGFQNIHYYNQPCTRHLVTEVNQDLDIAAGCFLPYDPPKKIKSFDLQLIPTAKIDPIDRGKNFCNNPDLGTTADDEMSLDEDFSSDIVAICPLDARKKESPDRQVKNPSDPGVSPANCPTIFVG
jgi:hypothetical protein